MSISTYLSFDLSVLGVILQIPFNNLDRYKLEMYQMWTQIGNNGWSLKFLRVCICVCVCVCGWEKMWTSTRRPNLECPHRPMCMWTCSHQITCSLKQWIQNQLQNFTWFRVPHGSDAILARFHHGGDPWGKFVQVGF